MSDHELFDRLAELPEEGPRGDFVADLESRLVRARSTDVGPATPTDQPIEGVILMPDTRTERAPRRSTWMLVAAAAALVIVTLAVFTALDDEDSSPVDVVTEPEVNDELSLPVADAPLLEVAESWMEAFAAEDDLTFRALHAEDAIVNGSPFSGGQPIGTLNAEATAERYWGGWEAYLAFNEAWDATVSPGDCDVNDNGVDVICTTTYGMFGPGSSPRLEFGVILGAEAGRISRVQTSTRFLDAEGNDLADNSESFDPEYYEAEIAPEFQSCLDIGWHSAECGPRNGDWWIAILEAFTPEDLVRP